MSSYLQWVPDFDSVSSKLGSALNKKFGLRPTTSKGMLYTEYRLRIIVFQRGEEYATYTAAC